MLFFQKYSTFDAEFEKLKNVQFSAKHLNLVGNDISENFELGL